MSRIMAYYSSFTDRNSEKREAVTTIGYFKVWKLDGTILEYGGTEDSRLTLGNSDPKAFRWFLDRISDRNGNSVVYHYDTHPDSGECYITAIDYTEHTEGGSVTVSPEFTVGFHYRQGYSQDYDFRYVAGNAVRSRKLLDHITVVRQGSGTELGRYSFMYAECDPDYYYDSVKMRSRLTRLLLEKNGEALNPTKIVWSRYADPNVINKVEMEEADTAIYKNYPFPGDFNGDGYTDLAVVPLKNPAYTNSPDIRFFMNDPLNPGHFTLEPSMTITGTDRTLDWLYPVDLNDDGLDDLVAFFHDSIPGTGEDTVSVKIMENTGGAYFVSRESIGWKNCKLLVRTGDFLGTGGSQLLLLPVFSSLNYPILNFPKLAFYQGNSVSIKSSTLLFMGLKDVVTGDFNGDGKTEVMLVTDTFSSVRSLSISGGMVLFEALFIIQNINHGDGRWNHAFPGDFNGDGMTDLLYEDMVSGNTHWRIFYADGETFTSSDVINRLGVFDLPGSNLYSNSLKLVSETISQPYSSNYWNYGVCVKDFDGDGADDIAVSTMTPSYACINIYCGYNNFTKEFRTIFLGGSYNGQHSYPWINCRSQYFHPGNYFGKENTSFLGLEYRNTQYTHNKPGVFSLKPESELNSVKNIIDGTGDSIGFNYGYVLQPQLDLGYGVRRPRIPVRVFTSVTSMNVKGRPVKTTIGYSDPCLHRDGHGWLGFRQIMRRQFTDNFETARTVSRQSLETMGGHAALLPETDTTWVFPDGTAALSSVTLYSFEKARNNYGDLDSEQLVVCPALTGKTVIRHDPDSPGAVLSKTFTLNRYNYISGFYWHTYHCDSTMTGVGDASASGYDNCLFRTVESTEYHQNHYTSWTLNKPHVETVSRSLRGKPDVVRSKWYLYNSQESFQVSRTFEMPGRVIGQSPFLLRTDFEYYTDGNLRRKTDTAPYGVYDEQQKSTEYTYGPGTQHRLVTGETFSSGSLSYTTSCRYDNYDLVDTLMSHNGLVTVCDIDPFGNSTLAVRADGGRTHTVKRWADGHPLAPPGASYYLWTGSSDGSRSLVFCHKTGMELRSVTSGLRGEPVITDRQYDNRGRLSAVSEPHKEGETVRWTEYAYDNLDRLVSATAPDGTVTNYLYDGLQTETIVTAPSGRTHRSSETVNAMGWMVLRQDAEGSCVTYDYCSDGLLAGAAVNGHPATAVTIEYDPARNRSSLTDPDYGTLSTVHDAYGRLVSSASPREQAELVETGYTYDGLDRPVRITDPLERTETYYTYNESGKRKGTLAETRFSRQNGGDIQRLSYAYDSLARPVSVSEIRQEGTYTTLFEYDTVSRLSRLVHPTGLAVRYRYAHGRLKTVTDDLGGTLWRTDSLNACGQPLAVRQGGALVTRFAYDPQRRMVTEIKTVKGSAFLQNLSYSYDNFGNLASRKDNTLDMEETFEYDNLDRLTEVWSGSARTGLMVYDSYGRMKSKTTDGGAVFTAANNSFNMADRPHALKSAAVPTGLFPSTTQTVSYTGFDKTLKVKQGNDSLVYTYGHDQQRIAMEERVGGAHRIKRYVGGCEYVTETEDGNTLTRSLTYLTGPFGVFAVVEKRNGEETLHYILKDNLGSWTTITDSDGSVEQRLSYDPWGSLRNPGTWSGSFTGKPMFDRGFTGHEHLTAFGLINMNGRMYDPVMSSFLSVDRFFQDPSTSQGFNRYAYCMYNPLRYVDPTGFYMTSGNRHHPDDPPHEIIDGQVVFWLPKVTITPYDEPAVTFNESPYSNTTSGGGSHFDWSTLINNSANGSTIGQGGGVNIGYGPNHNTSDNNGNNDSNLEIASDVLVTIGTYTMIKSAQYYNRLTRTWRDKLDITRSFDFHGNGATGGMNSFGKAMSNRYGKVGRALGFAGATMSFYQFEQATTIDGKFEYGFDTFIGLAGVFLPQFFGLPSTIWFLGGKQVAYGYARTTIIPMIEQGINPGLMEYQPFK